MDQDVQPYPQIHAQAQQSPPTYYPADSSSNINHELHQLSQDDGSSTGAPPFNGPAPLGTAAGDAEHYATHASVIDEHEQRLSDAGHLAHGILAINEQQQQQQQHPQQSAASDPPNTSGMENDIVNSYIKELATRLSSLESQLGPQAHEFAAATPYMIQPDAQSPGEYPRPPSQYQQPNAVEDHGRKRTFADMQAESQDISALTDPRLGEGTEDANDSTSAPGAIPRAPFQPTRRDSPSDASQWRFGPAETPRGPATDSLYANDTRETGNEPVPGWDDAVADEYYQLVHPTFPLLPHSKFRLKSRLMQCPPTLREAFLVALDTVMRDSPVSKLESLDTSSGARKAAALIAASQFEDTSNRTMTANLVHIQTMILMALESDHHGPANMMGQVGPPRSEWLGRAVGMAISLNLNSLNAQDRFGEGDPDADDKLGRRVWWILFILDRWHAASTSQLLQVPENSASLVIEDQTLLGDSAYHLVRLSYILGHISAVLQQPLTLMSRESAAASIITTIILGELDRFRESVESVLLGAPNLLHLSYWHVRLMVLRLSPSTSAAELLTPATRMARFLNSTNTPLTPLNHHFAALASMTLVELADFEATREESMRGIEEILEAHSGKRGFEGRENSTGWDGAIRELLVKRKANLESRPAGSHADSSESRAAEQRFDPTRVTRSGLLGSLVQMNRV
ncbi:MAG: hypothetical protein Q9159_003540 [Coniocarpon cinnabarinum]